VRADLWGVLTGLNTAAAGIRASQAGIDALAGDIANVNTVGCRRQLVAFQAHHEALGIANEVKR
jgi:flagellar basal body rod protein FlgG